MTQPTLSDMATSSGLEPKVSGSEPLVLPITPRGNLSSCYTYRPLLSTMCLKPMSVPKGGKILGELFQTLVKPSLCGFVIYCELPIFNLIKGSESI